MKESGKWKDVVSVIIPIYNGEIFISETINSVLKQTYSNLEIIIVDDGSKDRSVEVVTKLFPQFRLICQENQGAAAARNTGLYACSGRYFISLDQDDVLEPEFIEKTVQALEAGTYFGVVANGYIIDEHGHRSKKIFKARKKDFTLYEMCVSNQFCTPSQVLMDTAKLIDIGGFNASLRGANGGPTAEDWELWIRALKKYELGFLNAPLMSYRVHENNNFKKLDYILNCELKIIDNYMDGVGDLNVFKSHRYLDYSYKVAKYIGNWHESKIALRQAIKLNPKFLLYPRMYYYTMRVCMEYAQGYFRKIQVHGK